MSQTIEMFQDIDVCLKCVMKQQETLKKLEKKNALLIYKDKLKKEPILMFSLATNIMHFRYFLNIQLNLLNELI